MPDVDAPASERTPLLNAASSNGAAQAPPYVDAPRTGDRSNSPGLYRVSSHPADGLNLAPGAEEAVLSEPAPEDESNRSNDSPYLGGVSVTKFWLIFGGVLLQYFVSCNTTLC